MLNAQAIGQPAPAGPAAGPPGLQGLQSLNNPPSASGLNTPVQGMPGNDQPIPPGGVSQDEIAAEFQRRQQNMSKMFQNPETPLPDKLDLISKLMKTMPEEDPTMNANPLAKLMQGGAGKSAGSPQAARVYLILKTASSAQKRANAPSTAKLASTAITAWCLTNRMNERKLAEIKQASLGSSIAGGLGSAAKWVGKKLFAPVVTAGGAAFGLDYMNRSGGGKGVLPGVKLDWGGEQTPATATDPSKPGGNYDFLHYNPSWNDQQRTEALSKMDAYYDWQKRVRDYQMSMMPQQYFMQGPQPKAGPVGVKPQAYSVGGLQYGSPVNYLRTGN